MRQNMYDILLTIEFTNSVSCVANVLALQSHYQSIHEFILKLFDDAIFQ